MEDEEIRAALRRGRVDEAFRLFTRAHGQAAYSVCVRITSDRRLAEDVMQEAMLTAFRHRDTLLEVTSLRAWLITIAARKSLDAVRSTRRSDRIRHAAATADVEDDTDVVARLAASDHHRALDQCLAALDPEVRTAVLLRYREGLGWDEIAGIIGVPLDTIRMRVQRGALKSLRACLESKNVKP